MHDGAHSAQVSRGEIDGVRWEIATRVPRANLQAYVGGLEGYVEQAKTPVRRREFSAAYVVVILEFEPRLRIYTDPAERQFDLYPGGFVSGLSDRSSLTEHTGYLSGVQLNLHPLGARRVFGLPLNELRGLTVSFVDLMPSERHLTEELGELDSWDARFDRVERFLRRRLDEADPCDPTVARALHRIAAQGGTLNLDQLAGELGCSHKHLIARFHDQIGVPPKLWARLVRFERLQHELRAGAPRSWAELALCCGYYDQAHLARDVRHFTGNTPTALLQAPPLLTPGPW